MRTLSISTVVLNCVMAAAAAVALENDPSQPLMRRFRIDYAATAADLPSGVPIRVWLPVPATDDDQDVEIVSKELPVEGTLHTEAKHGNQVLYFETESPRNGLLSMKTAFHVVRKESRVPSADDSRPNSQLPDSLRRQYLQADSLVPIDGKPLKLLEKLRLSDDPWKLGRELYDRVAEHMTYKKEGAGWGKGDVLWACDSGYGNCTDFHSLFISLARSRGLPARFQIGFPLPPERGEGTITGYHCWAHFFVDGRGWTPVDISEADKQPELMEYYFGNLTENRVAFSTGRDLVLSPPQHGPPLNYFIDPYLEVDGKPWPRDKVRLTVAFVDDRPQN